MLRKTLGITLAICLSFTSVSALANTNVSSSYDDISISSKTINKTLSEINESPNDLSSVSTPATQELNPLIESDEITDSSIKMDNPIVDDVNETLLKSLQESSTNESIDGLDSSIQMQSVELYDSQSRAAASDKPIAELKYLILNPDSLKNGSLTTDTQIAWLWSYDGTDFTYDPNGYQITKLNIDVIPSVSDSILGTLSGDIGFVTQFQTAGQYLMKFKCMNENDVWSDEWSIAIPVEPATDNTRPECIINYTDSGYTDSTFTFSWANSYDNDAIASPEGLVFKDNESYPLSNYITSVGSTSCTAKFPQAGNYQIWFRVSDTNNAWSDWAIANVTVKNPQINTVSASTAWANILANPKNSTSQEAFRRSIPKSSEYFTSSVDASGTRHNYYLLTLEDKYKGTSNNYLTQFDTCLVYDENYVTSGQYHNGYYGTWFPTGSISLGGGVMSADLGYKKNSYSDFNDYKRLYIFDFHSAKDYTVAYYDFQHTHPYTVFYNLVNNDQIIYGRAYWFSDGSGNSSLSRIDRKTGTVITNSNIVFNSNSEISNGKMIDTDNFQFSTSRDGGYVYTININTLEIV